MTAVVHAALLGTGSSLGDRLLTSADLDAKHGLPEGETERASGVRQRHKAERLDQIDMGAAAARNALAEAEIATRDLDAILHASAVPYQTIPATAPLIQRALGLPDGACTAFDVNATCLGFLAALQTVAAMIEAQRWRHVLIVCSERASRGLDWSTPATAGLFGDGAGAAVIGPGRGSAAVGVVKLTTYPSGYDASSLAAGGTRFDHDADRDAFERHRFFEMEGRALFKLTRSAFQPFVEQTLAAQGWTMADVTCVVPHQASPRALTQMARALAVEDRIIDMAATTGNMISASLPIALHEARRTGHAGPGSRLLLLGTAAGVTFGAGCLSL